MSDRGKTLAGPHGQEGTLERAAARCAGHAGSRAHRPGLRAALAGGLVLGAGAAYFFDACQGAERRARLRGWLRRDDTMPTRERTRPLPSGHPLLEPQVRSRVAWRLEASADEALAEQARAAVAKMVARPDAVRVTASAGILTLRGLIAAGELKPLLRRVADVRGVEIVENKLEIYAQAEPSHGISPAS